MRILIIMLGIIIAGIHGFFVPIAIFPNNIAAACLYSFVSGGVIGTSAAYIADFFE